MLFDYYLFKLNNYKYKSVNQIKTLQDGVLRGPRFHDDEQTFDTNIQTRTTGA